MYTKSYETGNSIRIEGVDIPVSLPDMPPLSSMINYGLPREEQVFRRTELPGNLRDLPKKEERRIVADEWHKRLNGVWILIDGDPVYLTGVAYLFFNYWVTEAGSLPEFRFEGVEFFQIWLHVEEDVNSFGMFDIKCRRLGDTEKSLCCGWERVTRFRASWFGMQNKNDADAWENFQRVVMSNRDMVYFFKPVNTGTDMPQEELEFKFPARKGKAPGHAKELRSRVDYRPTIFAAYDGKRLAYFHGDEPGKVAVSKMRWTQQWPVIKMCLSLNNGMFVIGKAALTTTIEDMDNGDSVDEMRAMWEASDPMFLNGNGQTGSGLLRVFRGYWLSAPVDKFGKHLIKEAAIRRQFDIDEMIRRGRMDEVTSYKRKMPATIEDALSVPATECILLPHLIDAQIEKLQALNIQGKDYVNRPVRGNFLWKSGFGSDVSWHPDPHGRWEVSGHPDEPNKRTFDSAYAAPGNADLFAIGVDPVDDFKPKGGGSYGAIVVRSVFNPIIEKEEVQAFSENINWELARTGRTVCTYRHRPENPYEFFEDAILTMVYYGSMVLIEKNKPGLITFAIDKGLWRYISPAPFSAAVPNHNWGKPKDTKFGVQATEETIRAYIRELKKDVAERINSQTHMDLLQDKRKFTGEVNNRTKRDITVAEGWALLLEQSMVMVQRKKEKKRTRRFNSPIKTYRHGHV